MLLKSSINIASISFSIIKENEAIEVYEYLDPIVQKRRQTSLGEVLEIVENVLDMGSII